MRKILLIVLLASDSCFGMDNKKHDTEQVTQEISKPMMDASLDVFQTKLLGDLKTISCELTKMNEQNKRQQRINELQAISTAINAFIKRAQIEKHKLTYYKGYEVLVEKILMLLPKLYKK